MLSCPIQAQHWLTGCSYSYLSQIRHHPFTRSQHNFPQDNLSLTKATMISCLHHKPLHTPNTSYSSLPATLPNSRVSFLQNQSECSGISRLAIHKKRRPDVCSVWLLPVDAWQPNIDSESIAPQLFAFSLFPYLGFLYFITKSKSAPNLTLFGFYFLLAFVGATIPAGIYAKVHYGTSLSNVDWLHGGAESLLTLTNLFIVLGLRQALRNASDAEKRTSDTAPMIKEKK